MTTMTKYVPSWEKYNNRWDTEPEIWDNDFLDEEENEKDELEISLDDVNENDLLVEFEENFDE